MNISILMFLPELFLLIFSIGFLFVRNFRKKSEDTAFVSTFFLPKGFYFGLITLLVIFFIFSWVNYSSHGLAFHEFLTANKLTIATKLIILSLGIGWFGLASSSLSKALKRDDYTHSEYPSLFLFSLIGSFLLVSSHNFLSLYLSAELQIIPLCTAMALRQDSDTTTHATLKYFIANIFGSAFLLFGIALIFGAGGTLNFEEIFKNSDWILHSSKSLAMFKVGFILLLVGLMLKIALVPFQLWVVDIYEETSLTQVAVFTALVQVSMLVLLCRLLLKPFFILADVWKPLLLWIGLLSVAWGAFGALMQYNIRRLTAYANIAHMGWVAIGFGTGLFSGFVSALIYLFTYALTSVAFFFFWTTLSYNDQNLESLEDIKGLGSHYPVQSFFMAILLLSLSSLPPLAGFWAKLFIFFNIAHAESLPYVIFLASLSIVACVCYLRIIKKIYFEESLRPISSSYDWKTSWTLVPLYVIAFIGAQNLLFTLVKEALRSEL